LICSLCCRTSERLFWSTKSPLRVVSLLFNLYTNPQNRKRTFLHGRAWGIDSSMSDSRLSFAYRPQIPGGCRCGPLCAFVPEEDPPRNRVAFLPFVTFVPFLTFASPLPPGGAVPKARRR
jgi:hypothetical protein